MISPLRPPTPILLPGSLCDARIWDAGGGAIRRAVGADAIDADLTADDTIAEMAARALAATAGPLLPIGFSMGGNVALDMARQAPERIAAIALIDVNPAADLPARAATRLEDQARVRAGGLGDIIDGAIAAYFAPGPEAAPAMRRLVRDMAADSGPDIFLRQSAALRGRADLRSVVTRFDGPIFLACGADDLLCTPMAHEAMAHDATDATLTIIEQAGHMLPLEQPEQLAAALRAWLAGLAPSADYRQGDRIAC